ncbi:alpha/beta hydrolase, partial [Mesorhizobium sp. USDA-HM6]
PLCGWDASISMWRDVVGMALHAGKDSSFAGVRRDLYVNLAGGEKDPASDYGKAVHHLARRMDRMGFSNLVSKVYAETRHESLNEINRDTVMNDFAAWADHVLKSSRQLA